MITNVTEMPEAISVFRSVASKYYAPNTASMAPKQYQRHSAASVLVTRLGKQSIHLPADYHTMLDESDEVEAKGHVQWALDIRQAVTLMANKDLRTINKYWNSAEMLEMNDGPPDDIERHKNHRQRSKDNLNEVIERASKNV